MSYKKYLSTKALLRQTGNFCGAIHEFLLRLFRPMHFATATYGSYRDAAEEAHRFGECKFAMASGATWTADRHGEIGLFDRQDVELEAAVIELIDHLWRTEFPGINERPQHGPPVSACTTLLEAGVPLPMEYLCKAGYPENTGSRVNAGSGPQQQGPDAPGGGTKEKSQDADGTGGPIESAGDAFSDRGIGQGREKG